MICAAILLGAKRQNNVVEETLLFGHLSLSLAKAEHTALASAISQALAAAYHSSLSRKDTPKDLEF